MTQTRYYDQGWPLVYWASQVEVVCPNCGKSALVTGSPLGRNFHGVFSCPHCQHHLDTKVDDWQSVWAGFGRQPCQKCGYQWVEASQFYENRAAIANQYGQGTCPNCQTVNQIELSFRQWEPSHHAVDPYFGLDLALVEPTRLGNIWVYNAAHLNELKLYTEAFLREGGLRSSGYFSRLPGWIKSAKNRRLVLKAIGRLQARTQTSIDDFVPALSLK
ncbi:hypothetical protein [Celerinatantimonas sp. MCCC 1A17872]|uniref:hypothetical protein n=1 Tax=Celerinatantimonas sp. MCCC 1A17872 TaxID=3177514 RepID=UPI0038C1F316